MSDYDATAIGEYGTERHEGGCIPHAKSWGVVYKPTTTRPLLDMSQGVPGTPPPKVLLEALSQSSSSPNHQESALRSAFAEEMKTVYGREMDITQDDIAITAGCNMAFVATVMCLADPGDEIILPVPWYICRLSFVILLKRRRIGISTTSMAFLPSTSDCEKLINSQTKAIALVTPNNPTGAIYSPDLISKFAELAQKHKIALVLDETYRDFVDTMPPHTLFAPFQTEVLKSSSSWRSNVTHLFSFSKSYCFPGHRLGLIAASPDLLKHVTTTLDCLQICAPRPPQLALASPGLLPILRQSIQASAQSLKIRHNIFRTHLPPNWTIGSQGGYFAFVKHPFVGIPAITLCQRLAEELGVLALPMQFFCDDSIGPDLESFGQSKTDWERWIRFSVANVSDDMVKQVCGRLHECEWHLGLKAE
ncbi:pyridoxal phosphate-dependent transferase [Suillus subaureus]|uniref:Pyridoxal phosphate-dependent transferase n=1 Tax=Suillus subaureus TaxID=48587 RepID=A0A9P7E963_9AGAM|nr:pyridoxal phosphate-dependent transferase [Suillus subaureus]KAG1814770.1 pyridoxal phosphate-dependent transferase [Suillus subaureus]